MTAVNTPSFSFTKMHGLGNDFIIINQLDSSPQATSLDVCALANRHTGIGFDQLLTIQPIISQSSADFFCRIFNSDGTEAEHCGNGLRCIARYLHENQFHQGETVSIQTISGQFLISIQDYQHITVNMGIPQILNESLSLSLQDQTSCEMTTLTLSNPHAIMRITTPLAHYAVQQIGSQLATHPSFPNGTNVGFMEIIDPHHIALRTYERGVGETLACGSNACGAVVAGITRGWLVSPVTVKFKLGELHITWDKHHTLKMTGPAAKVYDGRYP